MWSSERTPTARRRVSDAAKRTLDVVGAAALILLASPVMLLVALAIAAEDRGPVFFRQERLGRGGAPFRIWKFRSMRTDAASVQATLADGNDSDGLLFKLRRDPRVTRVGKLLRRTSLDELPQLFNVLTGQMSLVGPRPLPVLDRDLYVGRAALRFDVRPGITGLWQVSGRSTLGWEDAVRLDSEYVLSRTLGLDLRILARTLPAVVRGTGAY